MLVDKHALRILAAASKDPSRYALNGLHVTETGLEATDGNILARVSLPDFLPDDAPTSWQPMAAESLAGTILDGKALAQVAKAIPKKERIPILQCAAIGKNGKGGQAVTGLPDEESRLAVPFVDATYPKTQEAYPKGKPVFQVALNARLLGVLASLGENDKRIILSFHGPEQAVEFQIDGERPITGLVMPMRLG